MYSIYCDDFPLYNPLSRELVLTDPVLSGELGKAGSLSFTINPTHPYYSKVYKMQSIISVFQDNDVIFKGRVFSDNVNFYKMKKVEVEGVLTYFNDSIVRPYEFKGSVRDYVAFLINQHNAQVDKKQRFKLGTVTVTDPNDYIVRSSNQLPDTWKEIEEKLIKLLGGYLRVRYTDNGNFIDYLAEMPNAAVQGVEFAVNLLDLESTVSGESISTCILPYGAVIESQENAEDEEVEEQEDNSKKRVDITSVNNGVDYIYSEEAVKKYGKIFEVVTFDDVTLPTNLLKKAKEYLANKILFKNNLTIKAVDLHLADKEIESFRLGDKIQVYSEPHGIKETMLIYSYSLNLTNPTNFVFSVNREKSSLLDSQIGVERQTSENVNRIDNAFSQIALNQGKINSIIREQISLSTRLIQDSEKFVAEAVKNYVKTSDYEEFKESIGTKLTQTAEGFDFDFQAFKETVKNDNGNIYSILEEYQKYIRFIKGAIELGEAENPLTTKIENGQFSFLVNGEVTNYFSNGKSYNEEIEVEQRLTIGNFAWVNRSDGSLELKKIK